MDRLLTSVLLLLLPHLWHLWTEHIIFFWTLGVLVWRGTLADTAAGVIMTPASSTFTTRYHKQYQCPSILSHDLSFFGSAYPTNKHPYPITSLTVCFVQSTIKSSSKWPADDLWWLLHCFFTNLLLLPSNSRLSPSCSKASAALARWLAAPPWPKMSRRSIVIWCCLFIS